MAGLTPTGFVRKTTAEILAEIEAAELAQIDPGLNIQPETPIGQINGIVASKLDELWELLEAVNAAQSPDNATGFSLDGIAAITGTNRDPATKGTVTLTLNLNAGVLVPAGSIASVTGDDSNRWVLTEDAENTGGAPADIDAEAEAETAGAIAANAGTIEVIVTPVAGWNTVTNAADAEPGTEIDTDTELRVKREAELARGGSATVNAIRADLLQVPDVISVTVLDNPTDFDVGGLPPHSVEAIVRGGDSQAIADALFDTVAAGIETYGDQDLVVTDDQGFDHDVRFSRPVEVLIYLAIDIEADSDYPADGDTLIAQDVVAYGDTNYELGDDVVLAALACPIFQTPGVVDITEIRVGIVSPPVQTTNYVIDPRELAILDFGRIVVNS